MMTAESKSLVDEAKTVESLLKRLETETSLNDAMETFRRIFEHWGFEREDEDIERDYLDDFVDENTGELRIISVASSGLGLNFYVIYAETWKDTLKYRQKLVKNLLKFTSGTSNISFANLILVLDVIENPKSKRHKYWKLIIPIYQRKLESAKLNVYVIDPEEKKFRTLATNIAKVVLELREYDSLSASLIKDALDKYMLVKPLTEEFFKEYKRNYYDLKNWIKKRYGSKLKALCPDDYLLTGESTEISKVKREEIFVERAAKTFAHTFFNRLMFVYFLQKKGWIVDLSTLRKDLRDEIDVRNFVKWLHDQYEEHGGNFYRDYLRVLFLYAMNRPRRGYGRKDIDAIKSVPSPVVRDVFLYGVPYFNGGLFSPVEIAGVNLDEVITEIDDRLMTEIVMGFFEAYNFTVTEETPYEVEVAVDPAMLGKIYESLIAEEEQVESEEERRASGIFYTPRSEVDFMCRMAVYQYLERNTKLDRDVLMKFVFTPPYDWDPKSLSWEEIDVLENALRNVKVVDPAAGSGAFLVGMYHLLIELHEKLTEDSKVTYKKKLEIIRDNIYGVDIKDWAIRVAKLRLWLALIDERGRDKRKKFPNEPVLPNLGTKLLVGDSLYPQGVLIKSKSGRKIKIEIPTKIWVQLIKQLKETLKPGGKPYYELEKIVFKYRTLADKYFIGVISKQELDKLKKRILLSVVRASFQQLFGKGLDTKTKQDLKKLKFALESGRIEEIPFIWELDFPDIFLDRNGFDIVIANPPYVRQEKIYPEYYDLAEFQMLPKKEQEKLKKAYKKKIINHMESIIKDKFKHEMKLPGRSDLYAYFFIQSVNLLNPKGSLVFITSNSWLDVDFGKALREFFLRFTHLRAVIDYTRRSFEQADVNTVITVLTRKPKELFNTVGEECVNFVLLKRDFEEIGLNTVGKLLECYAGKVKGIEVFGGKVYSYEDDELRVRSVKAVELAKMGGLKVGKKNQLLGTYNISGEYKGMKWGGILIRAPMIFYVILDKGKGKLVRLGEIAEVRFGIKTGANEFFYLEPIRNPVEWPVCQICGIVHKPGEGVIAVRNKAGWEGYIEEEFLRPVVKSPQEIKTYRIRPEDLKLRVFLCNLPKGELKNQGKVHALRYIEWGENKGYQNKPTCRARNLWWALGDRKIGSLASMMSYNIRFPFWLNDVALCDARLYDIYKKLAIPSELLASVLNTTLVPIIIELTGRANLGEGALDFKVYETAEILVVNPKIFSPGQIKRPLQAFEHMANREIKSIFEELGLPKPNRYLSNIKPEDVSLDKVLPDRRELDKVIFEILGLTEEEQLEVYRAILELVKGRILKAKSIK